MSAPDAVVTVAFVLVGVLHLFPAMGVLSADRLAFLYGTAPHGDLLILMRHRAVLFGLLGVFFVYAAFHPALQPAAFVAGFVSMLSFVGLAWVEGDYAAELRKVMIADLAASAVLALAAIIYWLDTH